MTIRHSSLQRDTLTSSATLLDSISRPIRLGREIGRGGEGIVYEVDGQPSLVAKVYHKRPLPAEQVAKLQAMASSWSSALETISAWPRSVLFDPVRKTPCGILMTQMVGARPLHELYGTANRRRHFPEVGWHHLVLAARNTAAAFQTLHSAGIVVGDVNQGNLLVDKQQCVRMIDCDSFQITQGEVTFKCPVGTPHFTPPELQSLRLREVVRNVNHDRFGLAILIFHLLFVGRHPFAGRYRGPNDLPIEKAIAERRFAFSRNSSATMMEPPPYSLVLDDLPESMANLFEAAFRSEDNASRPGPIEWVQQLDELIKRRKTCNFDPAHVYYAPLRECPWCRIEDGGGPSFFVPSGGSSFVSADRLAALDVRVRDLRVISFPELSPAMLALPEMPRPRRLKDAPAKTWLDAAGALLVASWGICLAGAFISRWVVAAASVFSLILAGLLLLSKQGRARRNKVDLNSASLERNLANLARYAETIDFQHRQRKAAFLRSMEELRVEIENYHAEGDKLRDVFIQHRESQKNEFLRGFLIRDNVRSIRGITNSQVTIMESYGLESANDLERLRLYGIPSIDPDAVLELLNWRAEIERKFVFSPDHGVTMAELKSSKEVAIRRFKISQARKILTAAKQLESLAETGKLELQRLLQPFEAASAQWKEGAKQLRDYQSGRQRFERLINRSPFFIIGLALAVPAMAWILHLLFR